MYDDLEKSVSDGWWVWLPGGFEALPFYEFVR